MKMEPDPIDDEEFGLDDYIDVLNGDFYLE